MMSLARRVTLPIAGLMTAASGSSLLFAWPFAKESAAWAAQGRGQDAVNLLVVVPTLLWSLTGIRRGSFGAWLVWLGVMIYTAYSYLLYSMFVHVTPLFPVYVATLSLAFHALFGSVVSVPRAALVQRFSRIGPQRATAAYLMIVACGFALLWGAEVAGAIASGQDPPSAAALGFIVNPVHVLDLAFALPAMFVTGVLLARRNAIGQLFAVPLLVFAALMSTAIAGMAIAQAIAGLSSTPALAMSMIGNAALCVWLARRFHRHLSGSHTIGVVHHAHAPRVQEG